MKKFTSYQVAEEHAGLTLESYLKQVLQYSGRRLQKLTRQKGILLNGKAVFLQKKVKAGDSLRVLLTEDVSYGVQPEEFPAMAKTARATMGMLVACDPCPATDEEFAGIYQRSYR